MVPTLLKLNRRSREIRRIIYKNKLLSVEKFIEYRKELNAIDLKIEAEKNLISGKWAIARQTGGRITNRNIGGKKDLNR